MKLHSICLILGLLWKTQNVKGTATVRLAGGSSPSNGRVELYYDGSWGTLCDDTWDKEDADVICRQLGFARALHVYSSAYFGPGSGPILRYLGCTRHQRVEEWTDCSFLGWGTDACNHKQDAGVHCLPKGNVRLTGGSSRNNGRVELYYNGFWGNLCDDNWGEKEANVICRQLGFVAAKNVTAYSSAHVGQGSRPNLKYLGCTGYEKKWTDCFREGWNTSFCNQNAAVSCQPEDPPRDTKGLTTAAIIIAVIFFYGFYFVKWFHPFLKIRRRHPGYVATITRETNPDRHTDSFTAQNAASPTTGNGQAPPSYNEVESNPEYYSPVAF